MVKEKRHSNRELKKPKKEKLAPAPTSSGGAWLTTEKLEARDSLARRKK